MSLPYDVAWTDLEIEVNRGAAENKKAREVVARAADGLSRA
jgi:hypothetical protein